MTKMEERKLDLEIKKLMEDLDKDRFYIKLDVFKAGLITVAVTTAVVSAFFKILG